MRLASWFLFVIGALVAFSTITGVVLNYSPVPFSDQWFGTVAWYMAAEQHWWPAFWVLHNEHRLLFSRLIYWPDMRWFGGVNILSLAGNVAACGLLAVVAYRSTISGVHASTMVRPAIAGVILAFCFSWMQNDNFIWGFQSEWFAVNMFALLAFHAMAVSARQRYSGAWLAIALLAGLASSFSMANGSFTWLFLIMLGLYWRFPTRLILLVAVTGAVEATAYFWDAEAATGSLPHGNISYVIQHQPIDWIEYSVAYLGSPMWYAFHKWNLALAAGALVLAGTALGFLRAVWRPDLKVLPLLALAAFLCITAFATGSARLVLGLGNVFQSKYATNALMVWMALLLFWMLNVQRRPVTWMLGGATSLALIAIVMCQPASLRPDTALLFQRLVAGEAMREGVYDHVYLAQLWSHDDLLKAIVEAARKQQLSILADNAVGYDNPPPVVRTENRCAGYVDGMVPTQTANKSRAEGWVFDPLSGTVPRTIVVTNAEGNTIGNGVVGRKRTDAAALEKTSHNLLGWVAFYTTTSPVHFLAKLRNGGFCRID